MLVRISDPEVLSVFLVAFIDALDEYKIASRDPTPRDTILRACFEHAKDPYWWILFSLDDHFQFRAFGIARVMQNEDGAELNIWKVFSKRPNPDMKVGLEILSQTAAQLNIPLSVYSPIPLRRPAYGRWLEGLGFKASSIIFRKEVNQVARTQDNTGSSADHPANDISRVPSIRGPVAISPVTH